MKRKYYISLILFFIATTLNAQTVRPYGLSNRGLYDESGRILTKEEIIGLGDIGFNYKSYFCYKKIASASTVVMWTGVAGIAILSIISQSTELPIVEPKRGDIMPTLTLCSAVCWWGGLSLKSLCEDRIRRMLTKIDYNISLNTTSNGFGLTIVF